METTTNGQVTNPLEDKAFEQEAVKRVAGKYVTEGNEFIEELHAGTITRDSKGRFGPGNAGGPGRPKKLTYEIFWDSVKKHATPEALGEIIQVAFEAAKCGDAKARDAIIKLMAQLHEFETNEQRREREEAQERISARYADILKKRKEFDFELERPSIAEEIYENLGEILANTVNLGNSE